MKKDIHPKVNSNTTVTCACGNSFVTQSTLPSINVEICYACHPFYTGTQRIVDTEGMVQKFNKKLAASALKPEKSKKINTTKDSSTQTQSLKDLLAQAKQSKN